MTVSKCDRCGAYVDREDIPIIRVLDPGMSGIEMDLCDQCYAKLKEFLKTDFNTFKEETKNVDQT